MLKVCFLGYIESKSMNCSIIFLLVNNVKDTRYLQLMRIAKYLQLFQVQTTLLVAKTIPQVSVSKWYILLTITSEVV